MKRIVIVALLVLVLGGCGKSKYASQGRMDRLEKGMTMAQVEAVMGGPGEEQKTFQVNVAPPGEPPTPESHFYSWKDDDGGFMLISFTDGKLTTATIHAPEKRTRIE